MARRKRQFLDDDDDSSSAGSENNDDDFDTNDPDLKAERALFRDPYQRKRRRKNGKEDALYGVFGDDSEEDSRPGRFAARGKTSDLSKAPAFVSGHGKTKEVNIGEDMQLDGGNGERPEGSSDDEEEEKEEEEEVDSSQSSEEDEDEEQELDEEPPDKDEYDSPAGEQPSGPRIGGIGFRNSSLGTGIGSGIGSAKSGGGLGFSAAKAAGGGLGFKAGKAGGGSGFPKSDADPSPSSTLKGGIGSSFAKAATQFSSDMPSSTKETEEAAPSKMEEDFDGPTVEDSVPLSFGSSNRTHRSFLRATDSPTPQQAAPLSAAERAHFSKLTGTFGARMLQKMGWQAGSGLGPSGEGIVIPVESKLRPQKMGIAFKGFREKTEQSKAEARRRGEKVSDDEEDRKKARAKKKGEKVPKREDAWKKKKVKTKIQHKTYEEIVSEAGPEPSTTGIGQIIDATGAVVCASLPLTLLIEITESYAPQPREVSSLAEVSQASWAPTADPTRIPEIRHNLRLIVDDCTHQLDGLAREAKSLEERKISITAEDQRLRKAVEDEAERKRIQSFLSLICSRSVCIVIARLQQVHLVVDEISNQARELASTYEATLDPFQTQFQKLIANYSREVDRYRLDEIVVAAIAPIFRRLITAWSPLEDPAAFIPTFRTWRPLLKTNAVEQPPENQVDVYGVRPAAPPQM